MKVVWMDVAEDQLEGIYEFEAQKNPKYAANVYNDIIEAADKYLILPDSAAREPSLEDMPRVYRKLVVMRRYKIIYRQDSVHKRVVVVSVWDCRRDPDALRRSVEKIGKG
jgi:plasmid stabilization system protein ParE